MPSQMDWFNRYLMTVPRMSSGYYRGPRDRIVCNDGFNISIQAGRHLYSTPREDGGEPYSAFEVGYPSRPVPSLMEYAEDPSEPKKTVYPYVPLLTIMELIAKHDGIRGLHPPRRKK